MSSSSSNVGVAIVTGSNKGLGFSIVKKLCKDFKGKVYLTSRDETKGRLACEEIRKELNETPSVNDNPNPSFHQLDVTDIDSIQNFVKHIQDNNEQVEILVNNAGVLFLKDSPEPKILQAERTISVNFTGLVDFTEEILPLVKNGGKIVNITSSSAHLSRIPSEKLRWQFGSKHLTLRALKNLVNCYIEDVKQNKDILNEWGDSPYVVSKVAANAYTFILHRSMTEPEGYKLRICGPFARGTYRNYRQLTTQEKRSYRFTAFRTTEVLELPNNTTRRPATNNLRKSQDHTRGIIVNCVHPGYVMSDMTRGAGSVTPEEAAALPVKLALTPWDAGLYVWHNGTEVSWVGADPRVYIDGRKSETMPETNTSSDDDDDD